MGFPYVTIDSDAHVIEPPDLWTRYMDRKWGDRIPQQLVPGSVPMRIDNEVVPPNGYLSSPIGATVNPKYRKAKELGFGARSHLNSMVEEGIDMSVLFPTAGLIVTGAARAGADLMTAAASAYNNWLSDLCSEGQGRLHGVGMLDLRDIKGACAEAIRCVDKHRFVGFFVRPNPVDGKQFYDPEYEPLWSVLEELQVPICFHEGALVALPQIGPDRFGDKINLWHMATHVMENQLAMVSMVLGGVCERHPKLRCGFMECGAGWLPYWMWRMDEHAETALRVSGKEVNLPLSPTEYVKRQCYVSADTEEYPAIHAMDVMDGRNVLWASDYPHADAKYPNALRTVSKLPGIEQHLERVLSVTPLEFFGKTLRDAAGKVLALRNAAAQAT